MHGSFQFGRKTSCTLTIRHEGSCVPSGGLDWCCSCLPAVHNDWAGSASVALIHFPERKWTRQILNGLLLLKCGLNVIYHLCYFLCNIWLFYSELAVRWKCGVEDWRTQMLQLPCWEERERGGKGGRGDGATFQLCSCCTHTYQWSFLWLCNWTETTSCKPQKWHWEMCNGQEPTNLH